MDHAPHWGSLGQQDCQLRVASLPPPQIPLVGFWRATLFVPLLKWLADLERTAPSLISACTTVPKHTELMFLCRNVLSKCRTLAIKLPHKKNCVKAHDLQTSSWTSCGGCASLDNALKKQQEELLSLKVCFSKVRSLIWQGLYGSDLQQWACRALMLTMHSITLHSALIFHTKENRGTLVTPQFSYQWSRLDPTLPLLAASTLLV